MPKTTRFSLKEFFEMRQKFLNQPRMLLAPQEMFGAACFRSGSRTLHCHDRPHTNCFRFSEKGSVGTFTIPYKMLCTSRYGSVVKNQIVTLLLY